MSPFPSLPHLLAALAATSGFALSCLGAVLPVDPDRRGAADTGNPLLERSTLPLEYPPFDRIRPEHFLPAFDAVMAGQLREVGAIAASPEPPTFDNTLVPLERAGRDLNRVNALFSNLVSANGSEALRAIESAIAPRLAAQQDAIRLNPKLFDRIDALFRRRHELGLAPESVRLIERYETDFIRAGAKLADPEQDRLRAINRRVAELETRFAQNVQNETNAAAVPVADRAELAGLSPAEIDAAAAAARAAGRTGFLIRLANTSGQPPLASLENRALRRRIMEASLARCSQGGEFDNRAIVSELARLRAERARLLGYQTCADYVLADQMAGSASRVNQTLARLAAPAVANARRAAAEMQALIDHDQGGFPLAAWDWAYEAGKVRHARDDFDEAQLKPYLELEHVLGEGVFYAATRLYGITFRERHDLPVYETSVRVFDVLDADGSPLALFIADLYARPAKRGGAWMNAYVEQSELLGQRPVVENVLNIPRPPDGQPTLLTFDEVTTLFHEFGHALHGMLSRVRYPRFSGTEVPRDFVEFPSQVNEMWATWPEVVRHYARHYQTGEPMPPALLKKLLATRTFDQGFRTTEYLAATLLDQAWHQLAPAEVPAPEGVEAFEAAALRRAGVDFAPVPPRYRSPYFVHVFQHDYTAGYYAYIWAEVLDADAVEWFKAHGGLTRANGDHLRDTVLSRGGSVEAMAQFRAFAGRDPSLEPLLKRRGLDRVEPPTGTRE